MLSGLLLTGFNNMAVLILTAYVFSRTRVYEDIMARKFTVWNMSWLVGVMGVLSIWGTVSGVDVLGNIANIRNLGPIIAGFVAGPLAGVLAGLIGGVHRYFMGGDSRLPCSIVTVLAGFFAGIVYLANGKKFVGIKKAVIFAAGIEVFHSAMVLLLYGVHEPAFFANFMADFDMAWEIEKATTLPRVLVVALGVGVFAFIIDNLVRERKVKEENKRTEYELKGAREIQMNIVPKNLHLISQFFLIFLYT